MCEQKMKMGQGFKWSKYGANINSPFPSWYFMNIDDKTWKLHLNLKAEKQRDVKYLLNILGIRISNRSSLNLYTLCVKRCILHDLCWCRPEHVTNWIFNLVMFLTSLNYKIFGYQEIT